MVNGRFIWIMTFCIFIVMQHDIAMATKNRKSITKINHDYTIKLPFFSMNQSMVENALKNAPGKTMMLVAGLITVGLYKDEIQQGIVQRRDTILGISIAGLLLGYCFHNKIVEKFCGASDATLNDEEAESDGADYLERFSQSGVRLYLPGQISTRFSDVAGLETAKEEMQDFLMFLQNSEKVKRMGAKIPKGILLSGAPGNGKTLLVRALAGEVGCPFLYISASEFIEAIVGVGAARVRHLFAVARELAPCIIFIDEIDAIGGKRVSGGLGGETERNLTLNQLLAAMDGFEQEELPIVVIGATNRVDTLDEALLRPGRFDRKIEVHAPFVKDRCKILDLHLHNVNFASDIDVEKLARATEGFSGAELAELVNQAAIIALRQKADRVTMFHLDQARDNMLLGRETKGMDIDQEEYFVTAVHEAGHALMHVYLEKAIPLYKVTITPRGGALGLTYGMRLKEAYSQTQEQLLAMIQVGLGGSVAEEMIFGHRGAGASSDLVQVRRYATAMVMQYGMTEEFKDVSFMEFMHNQVHLPDQIATKLHLEVAKVISECRRQVEKLLLEHREVLLELAQRLLQEGTVVGSDVYRLCGISEPNVVYSLTT